MKLFRDLFSKKESVLEQNSKHIDATKVLDLDMLKTHLTSIKKGFQELYNYKKKKITLNPSHIYWRTIDIEETWETSIQLAKNAHYILSAISTDFHEDFVSFDEYSTFNEFLSSMIYQIEQLVCHIDATPDSEKYSQKELHRIDEEILDFQNMKNRIHKYVMVDFVYKNAGNISLEQGVSTFE